MLTLALKSLWARRLTAGLTLLSLALSVTLLLGVERVRSGVRDNFASTVSGTDLIVGARSGQLNLLLYSVFRLGSPTNNISAASYAALKAQPNVAWTIPLSLGDSHRGFRVIGTTSDYFRHFRYGQTQALHLSQGRAFAQKAPFEVVLGAQVAKRLGYQLGQAVVIAHGAGSTSFSQHDNLPFTVVGILAPTATPVDHSVHVPLTGLEAIHLGWESGRQSKALRADEIDLAALQPKAVTAVLVGLKQRIMAFALQRSINTYPTEPLQAILPGAALQELWSLLSVAEMALALIAGFVVLAGGVGMLTTLLAGLNERRRELAILRSLGASPRHLFWLLAAEAVLLTSVGVVLGLVALYVGQGLATPWLLTHYGMALELRWPSAVEWGRVLWVWLLGAGVGLLPALRAYRFSLSDGLAIRY
ncbi:MAG: ABC transporter permease [Aeromonas sp.]